MSSKRRKQLKHNDLADALEARIEQIKPYTSQILLGVVLVVVLVTAVVFWFQRRKQNYEETWRDFQVAAVFDSGMFQAGLDRRQLVNASERHEGQPAGLWALQFAADREMLEGTQQIYMNRIQGQEIIKSALAKYEQVFEKSEKRIPMLAHRALIGIGHAHEALGQFEQASESFQKLADQAGDSAIGRAAERALARLKRVGDPTFYQQFVAYTPTAPTGVPNLPGSGLPLRPDLSYPDEPQPEILPDGDGQGEAGGAPNQGDDGNESPPIPPGVSGDSTKGDDQKQSGDNTSGDDGKQGGDSSADSDQ